MVTSKGTARTASFGRSMGTSHLHWARVKRKDLTLGPTLGPLLTLEPRLGPEFHAGIRHRTFRSASAWTSFPDAALSKGSSTIVLLLIS